MTVYKYPATIADEIVLLLPSGAQILRCDQQGRALCVWALVDPAQPITPRRILMRGTGHLIEESADQLRFINTILIEGGRLVFHFFEVLR